MRTAPHRIFIAALALQAFSVAAQQTVTRQTQFEYDQTTGLLTLERVDPGLDTCVETTYSHDAYGNREVVTTKACSDTSPAAFPKRITTNSFEASTAAGNLSPAGAYQTRSKTVTAGGTVLVESRATYDARFGTAASQTEVALADETKNLSKRTEYDGFGRVVREFVPVVRNADNSVQETYVWHTYNYCLGPNATSPSAACLNFSASVPVTYASGRLVDSDGAPSSTASTPFLTAYFVESTPCAGTLPCQQVIGAKSRTHFDSLHRQIAKETQSYDGRWVRTLTGYDALGQIAANWGAHFVADGAQTPPPDELRQWASARDYLHRPAEQQQYWRAADGQSPQALVATVTYNGATTVATVPGSSAPNGVARVVTTIKNAGGQTTRTINADGATLDMAYDPVGNLVRTVDPLGYQTTIEYTAVTARFKQRMVDPDQGEWLYGYDALGQLVSQRDARLNTVTMAYDELGRMTSKVTASLGAYWYYGRNEAGAWCAYGLNRPCENKTGNATFASRQAAGYDTLGRASTSSTSLDRVYTSQSSFDALGRLASVTYPTGLRVNYAYSAGGGTKVPGVLESVSDNANAARVFWNIANLTASEVFDAQGHLLKASLGNGVTTGHVYDSISGKAFNLRGGTGASNNNVFDQRYTYDKVNNLATRTEAITAVVETFAYDVLDRLTNYQVDSGSDAGAAHTVALKYNALGNVLEKGDVGGYAYSTSSRPHAVQSAGGNSYGYDANGNVTSTSGAIARTQTWTDFNLPGTLGYQGRTVTFDYDAGYKRVREVITDGAKVRTLYLVHPDNAGGLGFEREETAQGGSIVRNENRHYIAVGGVVVAVVKTLNANVAGGGTLNGVVSTDPTLTQYWHKDSLGSIIAVSDNAQAIERMAFDAWGRRQRDTGRIDPTLNPAHGDRGYTGHEHLDEVALVHMNARVYDPVLARFLSADPLVASATDLQSYNRYAYVLNNPLRYTDPTGENPALFIIGMMMVMMGNENWRMVGSLLMLGNAPSISSLVEQGLGNAVQVAHAAGQGVFDVAASTFNVGGFGNSFLVASGSTFMVSGGDVGQAVATGLFAGATTMVGGIKSDPGRVLGHALLGCVKGAVSSGKCGPSAMASAFSELAILGGNQLEIEGPAKGVFAAIAGGTASAIGGGKFGNGALQGAFVYLFNYCSSGKCTSEFEQSMYDWWPGYKAGTLLYNQTMGDGSWTGWEVLDAGSVGLGAAGKGLSLGLSGGSRSVFWSGWGAKTEAANLGTTLETTPVGRVLDFAQQRGWLGNGAISRWIWKEASGTFAGNATGQAQTVIRFNNPNSVFYKIELPILQRNGVQLQPR